MEDEGSPTLPPVPGIDLDAYRRELLARFSNAQVRDTVARLCAESSDRIPTWLLPVVRENLAAGRSVRLSAAVVASWARYAEGVDEQGEPIEVVDRLREPLMAAAARHAEDPLAFLRDRSLFGDLVDEPRFVEPYTWALDSLHRVGARATLEALARAAELTCASPCSTGRATSPSRSGRSRRQGRARWSSASPRSGVCGSDTHYYDHGRIGRFVVEQPLVLGHEASGEVVEVGEGVTGLRRGQRVSLEPGVPDLVCEQCRAGRYNLCPDMRFFATPPVDGAFAELVAVHAAFAHPVPDSMSDDAAALLEPLSVGIWACRKARVSAGSRVLVTGAGPIGLVSVQTALAFGATSVVVSDVNPARLQLALDLGATEVVDARTASVLDLERRPEVLLECSGFPPAIAEGIRALDRGRAGGARRDGRRRGGAAAVGRAGARARADRHLPLRQHLADGDRPRHRRPRRPRPARHGHVRPRRRRAGAHRQPARRHGRQGGRPPRSLTAHGRSLETRSPAPSPVGPGRLTRPGD